MVKTHCFDALDRELFNELDTAPVFSALQRGLDSRFR